jgi:hypothetical protein
VYYRGSNFERANNMQGLAAGTPAAAPRSGVASTEINTASYFALPEVELVHRARITTEN